MSYIPTTLINYEELKNFNLQEEDIGALHIFNSNPDSNKVEIRGTIFAVISADTSNQASSVREFCMDNDIEYYLIGG